MSSTVPHADSGMADDATRNQAIEAYVADFRHGRLTRREVLKKLAALIGSAAGASAFLAACVPMPAPVPPAAPSATAAPAATSAPSATAAPTAAAAPAATTAATTAPPVSGTVMPDDPAIEAKMIEYDAKGDKIAAYLAKPKGNGPFPIVLVCHENRGLVEHIKDVTRRFAKAGYAALAVDLLSREGGTAKVGDAAAPAALSALAPQRSVDDFKAGLVYMQSQPFVAKARVGMTGFCFGGAIAWRVATQMPELKAAVPFYGANPPLEDVPKINAAILALYGGTDTRINAGIPAIEEALKQNNKTFQKIVYDGAAHAFHNGTGANYNAKAAQDAWAQMLAWFVKYLRD